MLRSSVVCLGAFAALHGPCSGLLSSELEPTSDASAAADAGDELSHGEADAGSGPSDAAGTTDCGADGSATLVTLASGQTCPWGMAIDSTSVYWTTCGDPTGGLVRKAPKSGGAVTTLASGDRLSGVTVDETSVYWIAGTPDASSGAVMKAPLDGGAATTLAVRAGAPAHIAVDDTSVYWTELLTGAVMKVPLTGGTPIVVATTRAPWAIAVDATSAYLLVNGNANPGQGSVVRLTPK